MSDKRTISWEQQVEWVKDILSDYEKKKHKRNYAIVQFGTYDLEILQSILSALEGPSEEKELRRLAYAAAGILSTIAGSLYNEELAQKIINLSDDIKSVLGHAAKEEEK